MLSFTLVLEDDSQLMTKLKNRKIIVRTRSIENALSLYNDWSSENEVFCIEVHENQPLDTIKTGGVLKGIPIALHVPEAGSLRAIFTGMKYYRESSMRIFLPADKKENLIHLQIMSSIGIYCGLDIDDNSTSVDWEMINNLMYYSVYSRAEHTAIEPFKYTVEHFNPGEYSFFRTPYFDNPGRFLHIDKDENIALSVADLREDRFIAVGVDSIDSIGGSDEYIERMKDWQPFLEYKQCAYCPSWRICHGSYSASCERSREAVRFFGDLLEAAVSGLNKRTGGIWQL